MTIGSLFSGIGGLELGLERVGLGPVLWQVEKDEYCRQVLAKHWPGAKRYDDVCEVGSELEPVDIICGGFPCQDISLAGKGAGLAGERSGLWREFARIVGVVRPRIVVVENVAALLARGLGDVLGDLATLGYDAEWDCIPASAIGAPHQRDRLFVIAQAVADSNGERCEGQRLGSILDSERQALGHNVDGCGGEELANGASARLEGGQQRAPEWPRFAILSQWPPRPDDLHAWGRVPAHAQPGVCRVANGIPARVDRLRALGNAVVPQVAEVIGRRVAELTTPNPTAG